MRPRRFVVFDIDFDVLERFSDPENAVRFARWLARGREENSAVLVTDESLRGAIVWPKSSWLCSGAIIQ